ncbi:hypothetical protein QFZ77_003045 [Paenibacillus sp. V4I3]|jgi:hypothetical protein|uniref:hypothetical protein n=1 Tax=unclassified Paenibacillus TaxID=185978 RepID=UPI00277D9FCB|nr:MULTISPECIES: hypothetical protein [unclassified Paenibacillus]MDQ0874386.1 hypothetical protein [Paenibacillus sp. V4I3]MDQ0888532.1 hypothetical protein [Paenibacillus sp. V4I9]MDQ0897494.1 hypothetical protein [Paenibacillus sp. V4I7]
MNKTLSTDIELFAAALSQVYVVVSKDEMLDNAGIIREYCKDFVRVGDSWFARNTYQFNVIIK